jgi:hypothetical protein
MDIFNNLFSAGTSGILTFVVLLLFLSGLWTAQ